MSLLVDFEAHLGAVKPDGAVLEALFAQDLGEAVEREEFLCVFALGSCAFGEGLGMFSRKVEVGL